MARIKSAQKRTRQTARRTVRNQRSKRLIQLTTLRLRRAAAATDKAAVASLRAELDSQLDRAVKKNLIHPRKGGRKKSQAARLARPVTAWSAPRPPVARPARSDQPRSKPAAKSPAKSQPTPVKATVKKTPASSRRPTKTTTATRTKKTQK